ncbi:MAG TPA: peptidase S41 [Flavobacteriales bacterium]|nr:peptidase S41 [Crocinitomicaceae bacterium]HAE31772.1 peptidase S41 [Flavobacteriales bacterium]
MKQKLVMWSLVLTVGIGSTLFFSFSPVKGSDLFEITKNLSIFSSVYKEIDMFYVEEVEPGKLMKTGLDAMLKSLDPYTNYIPESKIEDYRLMTTGEYGGIGSLIRKSGEYAIITEPYEGYPAQKSGLRAGDKILRIDGKDMKGKSTQEVSSLLKGQSGTKLEIVVDRDGTESAFELIRENVKLPEVAYYGIIDENESVGYVKLNSFTNTASQRVGEALTDLEGKGMKKLVLDLRGNGGGLLNEAVNIVNFFIPKGSLVVETKGRVEEVNRTYKTQNQPWNLEIPVVVLIDDYSASASEIVAGSLQDLDRGVVIGRNSYGKGLVQQTKNLEFNAKVKLTIAKYYTPSGRCIQRLDYSDVDDDGSGTAVADSLIETFKTKNGREVKDGRGIDPDVQVDPGVYSRLTETLVRKNLIFNYATEYRKTNDSIMPAKEFEISDQVYDEFIGFLKDKNYEYKNESEEYLEALTEIVKDEKYYDAAKDEIEALKTKLSADKTTDLQRFKDEVVEILENEIVSRYYYQNGRIEVAVKRDPYIINSIEVLNDTARYNGILDGTVNK